MSFCGGISHKKIFLIGLAGFSNAKNIYTRKTNNKSHNQNNKKQVKK